MLAILKHRFDKGKSRLHAAHRLNDQIDRIVLCDLLVIVYDQRSDRIALKVPQIQHLGQCQLLSDPLFDQRAVCRQHLGNAGTDRPEAHDCYIHFLFPLTQFLPRRSCPIT